MKFSLGRLEETLLAPARHLSGVIECPEHEFQIPGSSTHAAPFFSRYALPKTESHWLCSARIYHTIARLSTYVRLKQTIQFTGSTDLA